MGEEYSVAQIYRDFSELRVSVGKLEAGQASIMHDLGNKHQQNRKDIHDIRGAVQALVDMVTSLRIQNARWSVGAGILTAVALKVIDHFFKS